MKSNKGITLIALTVTIVVLMILAGISIGVLTGDNGIINQARQAKQDAEISEEKEVVDISSTQATGKDKWGNLQKDILQTTLDINTGKGKTEVIDSGDTIVVKFVQKDRYYEINKDGDIEGPREMIKDSYAGDLTKGGTCDGTEENPFKITCIEDLVDFSNSINEYRTLYRNKHIILTRDLDFNSIFSYNNYLDTSYGDLNEDGNIEDIRTELTKKELGCVGFSPIGKVYGGGETTNNSFDGVFDGQGYEIKNIYQNREDNAGLFGGLYNATIKNLTVSGEIISNNHFAGGICASSSNTTIINCSNKANVSEIGKISSCNPRSGGIIGLGNNVIIKDCNNSGNISGYAANGGIAGIMSGTVMNCNNSGTIIGVEGYNYGGTGGIVGRTEDGVYINNCFNVGSVISKDLNGTHPYVSSGGILGNCCGDGSLTIISNSYNIGNVYGENGYGAIVGGNWYEATNVCTVNNSYFLSVPGLVGYFTRDGSIVAPDQIIEQSKDFMYSNQLVEKLNEYIENNEGTSDWKKWKIGENNYPVFENNT